MNVWWQAIRPKTLLASIGPILLATSLAAYDGFFNAPLFFATITCAVFLQIAVNLANDLYDGLSGVDNTERIGPVRVLQAGLVSAPALSLVLKICVGISVLTGLFLIYQGGIVFLGLGCLCILGVYAYSAGPFPLASNALGEVAVFLFFGLVAVLGGYYLQVTGISLTASIIAVIVGLQSSAIMLVNNIRDIKTDAAVGKKTLVVRLGEKASRYLYFTIILGSLVIHLTLPFPHLTTVIVPLIASSVFLPFLYQGVKTHEGTDLNRLLSMTALFGFVYAVSVSISLLLLMV